MNKICLLLCLALCTVATAKSKKNDSFEKEFVKNARTMAAGFFGEKLYKKAEAKIKKLEGEQRSKYLLLMVRYQVEFNEKPEEAQKLIDSYGTDKGLDKLSQALVYGAGNKLPKALQLIDQVGSKFMGTFRALAGEAFGDLLRQNKRFSDAKGAYKNSLKYLKANDEYEGLKDWEKLIKQRINDKLRQIQRLLDIEAFGPEYVAYRDAQALRVNKKEYIAATLAYDALVKEYPETIYAEAGKAYGIKSRLLMSHKKTSSKERELKALSKAIYAAKNKEREAKRAKLPEARIKKISDRYKTLQARAKKFKSFEEGKKALETSEALAKEFVNKSPFGLYRCEVVYDFAYTYLYYFNDVKKADEYFTKLAKLFKNIERINKAISTVKFNPKSVQVSKPPQNRRSKDGFGNDQFNKPSHDSLFNRRTCPWYLMEVRENHNLYWGLISYLKEDYPRAEALWEEIYNFEPFYIEQDKKPFMSLVSRLKWNLEHNQGAIYTNPEDVAAFRGKPSLKIQLFIADLNMESENIVEATKLYKEMLANNKLTVPQKAVVYFSLAMADQKQALVYLKPFLAEFKKTPTAIKALHKLAALYISTDKIKEGFYCLNLIVRISPNRKEQVAFLKGFHTLDQTLLDEYLKQYPQGDYVTICKKIIGEIQK